MDQLRLQGGLVKALQREWNRLFKSPSRVSLDLRDDEIGKRSRDSNRKERARMCLPIGSRPVVQRATLAVCFLVALAIDRKSVV